MGFKQVRREAILPDAEDVLKEKDKTVQEADFVFGPGGEHSDFTLVDWFGKKDLKTLLGFKNDINYKQYLLETDKGIFPIPNEQVEGLVK